MPPLPLFSVPPCGAVTVKRADAFEEEEDADADEDADFRCCCKSIVPAATKVIPALDRRRGRRKAEENSLEAGNEEVRERDLVLSGGGVEGWMEFI